ncbi:cytochrome c oxidase assembly protein COX18, mitochondrial isoform X3 [Onychostruthus taczanowskii]|uniref:cytochrome c oxidase assembly protein COX18, mitochondrial isoform X3 n=1 Tax=Onychostruthus taczanowskii TaxID=356909 RepID=UPI001B80B953|nr:cytochrome c oxidase assembly protein COX18, mitochondrial isoform X3 [Onychostruthus taczanowskii]
MRRIVTELYVRDNCHPFKATLLLWVQVPMWVCVSLALRNCSVGALGSAVQEQFSSGGALWFTDLTAPDSTWILPLSLGLVNLLVVEIFASQTKVPVSRIQKIATNFFRAVSVVMIPIAATVPSCRWHFSPEELRDRQLHFTWKPLLQMRAGAVV